MSISNEDDKKRLRKYLNPTIQGDNVDAMLETLSSASAYLINNVKSVNDMLYISTAVEEYLDQRLADWDLVRPQNVGLEDDIFRKLGIEVANRKQVRDLISNILEIFSLLFVSLILYLVKYSLLHFFSYYYTTFLRSLSKSFCTA